MQKFNLPFVNQKKPNSGCFLLSDPFEGDAIFDRSVVYICEHGDEGTVGVVLNKWMDVKANDVLDHAIDLNFNLSIGGPVSKDELFYMHTFEALKPVSLYSQNGLYLSSNFESLREYTNGLNLESSKLAENVRFFLGYSGWTFGQLESEIERNSWIAVDNLPINYVFKRHSECLWKKSMNRQGVNFKLISEFPKNPSEN